MEKQKYKNILQIYLRKNNLYSHRIYKPCALPIKCRQIWDTHEKIHSYISNKCVRPVNSKTVPNISHIYEVGKHFAIFFIISKPNHVQ